MIIGLINYPRFPRSNQEICNLATNLAKLIKKGMQHCNI